MANILNVLSKTRKGGSETLVELDDPKKTKVWRPTGSVANAPTLQTETPTGDISGDQDAGTRTFNFHTALKSALNEGAGARKASQFGAVKPFISGGVSGMSSVTDFITRNTKTSAVSTFESATTALKAQIEETRQQREFNYDVLSDMAADGTLETLPNSALESMARQAGISFESALAWKARVSEVNKMAKEDRELKRQEIQADIEADRRRNTGGGRDTEDIADQTATLEILDELINDGVQAGLSPQEILEQANLHAVEKLGIELDVQTQQAILNKARGISVETVGEEVAEDTRTTGGGRSLSSTVLGDVGSVGADPVGNIIKKGLDVTSSFFSRLFSG